MPDPAVDRDIRIRLAALEWLREQIYLPHHREHHPDRERLERRYRRFRATG